MGSIGRCLLILGVVFFQPADLFAADQLVLHTVPLSVQSLRLLGMSMDEDGSVWLRRSDDSHLGCCYRPPVANADRPSRADLNGGSFFG